MNLRVDGDDFLLDVLVQPRASRARVGGTHDNRLKIAVTAPPADGAANKAVIEALHKALRIPKRNIEIVRGHSSRQKTIKVHGVTEGALRGLL